MEHPSPSSMPSAVPSNWFVDPVNLGMPAMRPEDEALSWQGDALCAQTDPEAFFPEKGGSTREAKRICESQSMEVCTSGEEGLDREDERCARGSAAAMARGSGVTAADALARAARALSGGAAGVLAADRDGYHVS